jgi:hypothetical protein
MAQQEERFRSRPGKRRGRRGQDLSLRRLRSRGKQGVFNLQDYELRYIGVCCFSVASCAGCLDCRAACVPDRQFFFRLDNGIDGMVWTTAAAAWIPSTVLNCCADWRTVIASRHDTHATKALGNTN